MSYAKQGRQGKSEEMIETDFKEDDYDLDLKQISSHVAETNRKIDKLYDEKLRILSLKKKLADTDEDTLDKHQERIAMLKERYSELQTAISKARKDGKDPFIAQLVSKSILPKIMFAQATKEGKDCEAVEDLIKQAQNELQDALNQEVIDVKNELAAKILKKGN
jgi:hypothetical protein